jgi:VanZ family protein
MIAKLEMYLVPLLVTDIQRTRYLRWLAAIVYTAALTVLLLQSSAHPLVGPVAPKDYNLGWEILLTIGHLIGFGLLVLLVWSALITAAPFSHALITAVVFACLLGLVTEVLQSMVPDRSVSLFDLAVNWVVSAGMARYIYMRLR